MSKGEHTPLPWKAVRWSKKEGHIIGTIPIPDGPFAGEKPLVCLTMLKADAAFAVRACNNHYALVEAIQSALRHRYGDWTAILEQVLSNVEGGE